MAKATRRAGVMRPVVTSSGELVLIALSATLWRDAARRYGRRKPKTSRHAVEDQHHAMHCSRSRPPEGQNLSDMQHVIAAVAKPSGRSWTRARCCARWRAGVADRPNHAHLLGRGVSDFSRRTARANVFMARS